MFYKESSGHGIEAQFNGIEVVVVRRAFVEDIHRLRSLRNDSSISDYTKWVARWKGATQTYRSGTPDTLRDPLRYFVEATEDRVDELLDTKPAKLRLKFAARRYELGWYAAEILDQMEQYGEQITS
jgi:hypothetical protein